MKKQIIALTFLTILSTLAIAQSNRPYSSYEKEEIFRDDFTDNRNNWRVFYSKVKKGKYTVETIGKDQAAISSVPVEIDTRKNFEIETVVSMEWNRSAELMGIVWNRDLNSSYAIGFNKQMQVKVYRTENGQEEVYLNAKNLGILLPMYEKNTITIRKIDSEYKIYINKLLVQTIPFEQTEANHIGYFVGTASEIQANSLVVSYLK